MTEKLLRMSANPHSLVEGEKPNYKMFPVIVDVTALYPRN